MRSSHNNGEDKPPINLSTDTTFNFDSRVASQQSLPTSEGIVYALNALHRSSSTLRAAINETPPTVLGKTSTQGQGHPCNTPSTDTSRDVHADRCTASCQPRSDIRNCDSANTQASNHASVISKNEAPSKNDDEKPTTPDGPIVEDGNTYPEGGLRAWLVVFGSFSGMVASFGILNTVGTFQAYLSTHQLAHHSPASIGWIFSIFAFLTFFCGVQIGPVFDAKGPRWLVVAGSVFLFAGLMGVAESTSMYIRPFNIGFFKKFCAD